MFRNAWQSGNRRCKVHCAAIKHIITHSASDDIIMYTESIILLVFFLVLSVCVCCVCAFHHFDSPLLAFIPFAACNSVDAWSMAQQRCMFVFA